MNERGNTPREPTVSQVTNDNAGIESGNKCRLLLVDDHVILRLGLRSLLSQEPDLEVVAEAGDADEALQRLAETAVDVVITDLTMPGRSGFELLAELRECFPRVKTLVLTELRGDDYVHTCLSAGVTGYALKSSSHAEFLEAIRTVRDGERFVCKAVSARIVTDFIRNLDARVQPVRPALVTRRERDVLTRVASGLLNREIAAELGLSLATVRKYRQTLMKKFSLHNAAAVTAFAVRNGYISA
jgi:DNA-binding NarL/FixJ family response regulator